MKGSLSARAVAAAIESGIREALQLFRARSGLALSAEIVAHPVADGGDDTVEVIADRFFETPVVGPFRQTINARWGAAGYTAVIELAKASGIALRSNPEELRKAIEKLDANLGSLSGALTRSGGKSVESIPGMGASGGFPLGFSAFLDATLGRGADLVLKTLNFEKYMNFDAFFTSEGFCDTQTLHGKAPYAVCKWLKGSFGAVLSGGIESHEVEQEMRAAGASIVLPICEGPITVKDSMDRAPELLARAFYSFLCARRDRAPLQ
jgi:glycerate kinase